LTGLLYRVFHDYLVSHTQHQGSFYKRLPGVSSHSGVLWADHGASAPHHEEQTRLGKGHAGTARVRQRDGV